MHNLVETEWSMVSDSSWFKSQPANLPTDLGKVLKPF